MRLVVGLVFEAFKAQGRVLQGAGNGGTEVGDGVSTVLQVETVARGVQAVDSGQPVEMFLPRLVGIEGVYASSSAPRYVINCEKTVHIRIKSKFYRRFHSFHLI